MSLGTRPLALVTGANRGLGYCAAEGIAKAGFDIVMGVRDAERGDAAATKLREAVPQATFHVVDGLECSEAAKLTTFVQSVRKQFGDRGFDVILNNAGVMSYSNDYKNGGGAVVGQIARQVVNTNFFAPKRILDELLPITNRSARIVNVASELGYINTVFSGNDDQLKHRFLDAKQPDQIMSLMEEYLASCDSGEATAETKGWPARNPYGVSKLGLLAYSALYATNDEVLAKGITVNTMCPGWCKTDMCHGQGIFTAKQGADTMVWLCTSEDVVGRTGLHFKQRTQRDWRK
jgi:carbonyl reductase 1